MYLYSNQKEIMQNTHNGNTRYSIVIWAWEFGMLQYPLRWARR